MTMRGGIWEVLSTTADPNSPGGFAPSDPKQSYSASIRYVTPRFFETIGTPILQGRDVSATDTLDTPFVAVVSESFARQPFPESGSDRPIVRDRMDVRTIVGVVGDIRFAGSSGRQRAAGLHAGIAAARWPAWFYAPQDLVIRATRAAGDADPGGARDHQPTPIRSCRSRRCARSRRSSRSRPRRAWSSCACSARLRSIAFLLAAIGIHGLLAFTVASRSREIGVRIALGAKARDIMWMVMGRSTMLAIIGVSVGAVLAYAAGRSMQALLFGVDPGDVARLLRRGGLSFLMALAGSLAPAWRAVRVDPITATRAD